MKTKHTPGPWEMKFDIDNTVYVESKTTLIADNLLNESDILDLSIEEIQEYKANAKLIAAAPDLLEACQELIAELDNRESQYGYPDTGGMILARMAIKKAGAE